MDHPTERQSAYDRDRGATMVEYSLMMALLALVAFAAVTAFGMSVNDLFDNDVLLTAFS